MHLGLGLLKVHRKVADNVVSTGPALFPFPPVVTAHHYGAFFSSGTQPGGPQSTKRYMADLPPKPRILPGTSGISPHVSCVTGFIGLPDCLSLLLRCVASPGHVICRMPLRMTLPDVFSWLDGAVGLGRPHRGAEPSCHTLLDTHRTHKSPG